MGQLSWRSVHMASVAIIWCGLQVIWHLLWLVFRADYSLFGARNYYLAFGLIFWRSARFSGVRPDFLAFSPVFWRSS
ncbi:hypothetical protein [Sporosarcina cyprini]|uniref:hypothetical protein n=1 Tax=Sporosarcina cyprini TaxID=2910523 RepID=UPI001EE0C1A1|nr:hypothetical protein [Sporosarcina cyprini]MCG3087232.1 hypothetical protein [Sporosarcina cyprini]